jgi:hypothetical protein
VALGGSRGGGGRGGEGEGGGGEEWFSKVASGIRMVRRCVKGRGGGGGRGQGGMGWQECSVRGWSTHENKAGRRCVFLLVIQHAGDSAGM